MARSDTVLSNVLVLPLFLEFICGTSVATQLSQLANSSQTRLRVVNDNVTEAPIVMKQHLPTQDLMICNAYAATQDLDIFDVTTKTGLTKDRPLPYKDCANFHLALKEGEELEFLAGNLSVGVFRATGLPRGPSSLLLVPHRRTSMALNAAFESHAFADIGSSQLVVIDVFKGKDKAKVKISDTAGDDPNAAARLEDLKFNSVVQVNRGNYQLLLQDGTEKSLSSVPLHVSDDKAKYVVLRLGNQPVVKKANSTMAFPQELVVHKQNEQSNAKASAPQQFLKLLGLLVAAFAFSF